MAERQPLVDVQHLTHVFGDKLRAVNDVSFSIFEGETFGLVGESGCGKTTTGRMLVRLLDITAGTVRFDGQDITQLRKKRELLRFRRDAQIIFQDPYASLDPRKKVCDIVAEGIDIHHMAENGVRREEQVARLLADVGNVSQVVPTIQPHISITDGPIRGHSEEMVAASCAEKGLNSIPLGAKALALTALDLIQDPQLLASIKEEHDRLVKKQ